ncbi:hypothetical protein [Streptomyces monomycini]|nr:hypothetical protein [Streptomyces monomycini]
MNDQETVNNQQSGDFPVTSWRLSAVDSSAAQPLFFAGDGA